LLKLKGKIIFAQRSEPELDASHVLGLEMYLNDQVAKETFKKFGISIRVHITGEHIIPKGVL
jgi:hypothetical protein